MDILDVNRGTKVAGFRGYFLKNKGALMQLGLMRYGFDKLMAKGFTPMIPPVLDLPRSFTNTGHFPGVRLMFIKLLMIGRNKISGIWPEPPRCLWLLTTRMKY